MTYDVDLKSKYIKIYGALYNMLNADACKIQINDNFYTAM